MTQTCKCGKALQINFATGKLYHKCPTCRQADYDLNKGKRPLDERPKAWSDR